MFIKIPLCIGLCMGCVWMDISPVSTKHAACSFQTEGLIDSIIRGPGKHEARQGSNREKMGYTAYKLLLLLS